ncbi:MAG: HD-GYP domain-containing protein [Firmicutes bacterium]|nr:HD-GYP domain-containing protein [Bacillota bacterium]
MQISNISNTRFSRIQTDSADRTGSSPIVQTGESIGSVYSGKMDLINPAQIREIKQTDPAPVKAADLASIAARTALEATLKMSGTAAAAFPGLIQAIKIKDDYTGWHVDRVAKMSGDLAKAINLPPEEQATVNQAAVLHDVGKILTPISVLNKPGALTDEEFTIMKQHAADTEKLLSGVKGCVDQKVISAAKSHHERWDGKGYPCGLKGEEIPVGARIIALADTYDAITSDRPYRKGAPKEKALEIMAQNSGTQFDPKLLDAFLKMMGQN